MRAILRLLKLAVAVATLACPFFGSASAAADTVLYFQSQPGDYIGQGQAPTIRPADGYTITSMVQGNAVTVSFSYDGPGPETLGQWWDLRLRAPAPLAPGVYEGAMRYPFEDPGVPGLDFTGDGRGCNELSGRFVIHEIAIAGGQLQGLAVDFEQHCELGLPALYGQLRFNSSIPIDTSRVHPDPWRFTPVKGVQTGLEVTSNSATMSGFDIPLPVAISGGEYSIDGGTFTSSPGTIRTGQSVRVRLVSSAEPNRLVTAVLSVGDFHARFHVGTEIGEQPQPNGDPLVVLATQPPDAAGAPADYVFSPAAISDITLGRVSPGSGTTVTVHSVEGDFQSAQMQGQFTGPNGAALAPGNYPNAVPHIYPSDGRPQMNWNGYPVSGCYQLTDSGSEFTVLEIEYGPDGTPSKLALDFKLLCPPGHYLATLFGHVRFNSTVPIDYTVRLPFPFAFPSVADATPGSIVHSNEVLILGINVPVPVSIAGGEYSIDGGAYVSLPGVISAGQRIRVRLAAPNAENTLASARLTVGERTADFLVGTDPGNEPQPTGQPLMVVKSQPTSGPTTSYPATSTVYSAATMASLSVSGQYGTLTINGSFLPPLAYDLTSVRFQGVNNAQPVVGHYTDLRLSADATHAGLYVTGGGPGCSTDPVLASVTVHEIGYSPSGSLLRLAMDFVIGCPNEAGGAKFGYVRYNSTYPIDYQVRIPHPFSFAPVLGVAPGSIVVSEEALIEGTNAPSAISVEGGEYSIDFSPFTTVASTVSAGQRVRVRVTAAPSENALRTARLSVDRRRIAFDVGTSIGTDPQPNGQPLLIVVAESGDPLGGETMRTYSGAGLDLITAYLYSNSFEFRAFRSSGSSSVSGTLSGTNFSLPSPGYYPMVSRNATLTTPGLRISIDGMAMCSEPIGSLWVHEAQYGSTPETQRLAMDFVLYCDANGKALRGYYRHNSTIPVVNAPDSAPDPFSLGTLAGVARDQWVTSIPLLIRGINATASVTVAQGEVSINDGPFGSAPTSIHAGQTIRARLRSSPNYDELRTATVTIGGVPGTLSVRTLPRPTLTVSVTNGAGGTVTSNPAGIACPPTCSASMDEGVPITLTATPAAGASFGAWSGACSGSGACQLSLAASASVTATFTYPLTVSRTGMGSGSVSSSPAGILCGSACGAPFTAGSTVTLNAAPSASSRFMGWLGACSGTGSCTVTMNAAQSAVAIFFPIVAAPDNARHDWNGDGRPDLLLRHPPSGTTIACYMVGLALQSCALADAPGAGSAIVGVGDFSADGHTDLLALDMANSHLDVWRMNGTAKLGESPVMTVESPWTFEAAGDFNADGKPDLVLRHGVANLMIVVYLDGAAPVGAQALFPLDASWKIQAMGDFDRDGHPDLVLRHASGAALIWGTGYSGGATTMAAAPMGQFALDPAWEVAQVADWNGDGKVDLLMRNASTGEIVVIYCDGASLVEAAYVLQVDPAWEIVPRR